MYLIALLQSYFLECEIAIHQVRMGMWHLAVSPSPFALSVMTGVPFCYPKNQINHHSPTKKIPPTFPGDKWWRNTYFMHTVRIINQCHCWSYLYLFLLSSESDCFLCILTFVLVYYFSMAGAVWFVILAFSWSICFKSLGSTRDNFAGKVVYFHIIAWTYPLTLAISVLALKQVIWHSLNPWT